MTPIETDPSTKVRQGSVSGRVRLVLIASVVLAVGALAVASLG